MTWKYFTRQIRGAFWETGNIEIEEIVKQGRIYGDTEIEMPVFMEGISAVGNAEKEMNQKVQEKGNTEKVWVWFK